MSAITVLGSARRACSGPTRRETLKVGALSLLGGLFNTRSLLALEESQGSYLFPAKAKSVILLYLQGGPPTQDMFDMKPHAPDGVGGEFKPIASSVPGIDVCELLPLTARTMHHSAVVRSVYHNGGCHKNLPMYTGFDVNLPDEEFRDSRSAQHGLGVRVPGARAEKGAADVRLPALPAWLGRGAKEGRPARRIPGPPLRPVFDRLHGLRRPPAR